MASKNYLTLGLLALATFFSVIFFWPDGKLHLVFCDVGQGDAILVYQGFNQILIDGGPGDKVLGCLSRNMPFWDRTIELVVNSHPDKDHLWGLTKVVRNYQIDTLFINGAVTDTDFFTDFRNNVIERGIKIHFSGQGEEVNLGGMNLKVLWPEKALTDLAYWRSEVPAKDDVLGIQNQQENLNSQSVSLYLSFSNFTAIFPGDIEKTQEDQIVDWCNLGNCRPVSLLKVAHHGSKTSTGQGFLDYFRPRIAVISVGKNSWGHPTNEVLGRLEKAGSEILRTDKLGDIRLATDGQKIYK